MKNRFLDSVYCSAPHDDSGSGVPAADPQSPKKVTSSLGPLKLLLSVDETMAETGLSRTVLYRKFKSGEIPALKIGTRTVVRGTDLMDYIDGLPRLHRIVAQAAD